MNLNIKITSVIIVFSTIGISIMPNYDSQKFILNESEKLEYISFISNYQYDGRIDNSSNPFHYRNNNTTGPLGEWPDFTPIGFITAPHPDYPQYQTHLYGDWGGIVGEEFIFLQNSLIKLLYHSYHETYLTERPHELSILDNWTLGYDPITKIKYTPLIQPGGPIPGPAWDHTDTPGYIQHPITGEHLLYNTVRPGTKYLHPEWDGLPGWEGAIQVATSITPPTIGVPFNQTYENMLVPEYWWEEGWNQNGEIKGGLSEPTPVWVPHLGTNGKIRLFYRGLHGSPGSYWNWRISYADSEDGKTGWIKNTIPTFDPSDPNNPAYQWTLPYPEGFSFRGAWQAHCKGDIFADGVHMVMTVSNQNYAGFGHIAYYWSPDWGDTWIGHPDNPIIAPGQFPDGVPAQGFQRTPTLLIDEEYGRYILGYNAGHDINQKWKRRTYIATAPRPSFSQPLLPGWNLITIPVGKNWYASDLADNISGSLSVSKWDNVNQTYQTYIVNGPPVFDFPIENGSGYFVDVNQSSVFSISGNFIENVSVSLKVGWNLLGWYHQNSTTASNLANNINGSLSVSQWDNVNQTYKTFIVGGPLVFDFIITKGMGVFVDVDQESVWYGEG
jgi:hypothetical protein